MVILLNCLILINNIKLYYLLKWNKIINIGIKKINAITAKKPKTCERQKGFIIKGCFDFLKRSWNQNLDIFESDTFFRPTNLEIRYINITNKLYKNTISDHVIAIPINAYHRNQIELGTWLVSWTKNKISLIGLTFFDYLRFFYNLF